MDWIEQWFGFAPDNGDGTLEALLVIIGVVMAIIVIMASHPRGRRLIADACGVFASLLVRWSRRITDRA
jgi:hypothetical protein